MSAAGIAAVNASTATDEELVAAVRAGDDIAFEELYRRYHPRIAAFVRRLVRDHGRAEDVTQEAFIAALRRVRQTDAPICFKPWIFEIARNRAIDLFRRGSRAEEVSIDIDAGRTAAEATRFSVGSAADSSLLDRERLDHLRGALAELSETHHRIIVLRELEGLSYHEIGDRMELTPSAVESTLFRARRKLQHEYAQLDTGRRCQLMGIVIARLAEGFESDRDRRRLDRHARRCSCCRRRARELGVEPVVRRRGLATRVGALLPLPALVRRRDPDAAPAHTAASGAQSTIAQVGAAAGPAVETGMSAAGKAVATLAAVALVGGGGATLGGVGPLAVDGGKPPGAGDAQRPGGAPPAGILERLGSPDRKRAAPRRDAAPREGQADGPVSKRPKQAVRSPADPERDGVPGLPQLPALPGLGQGAPGAPPGGTQDTSGGQPQLSIPPAGSALPGATPSQAELSLPAVEAGAQTQDALAAAVTEAAG